MGSCPLASGSVRTHYARGALGLLALVAGIAIGGAGLLLLLVTVAAWRGCPTCWAIGLMQTRYGTGAPPKPTSLPSGST